MKSAARWPVVTALGATQIFAWGSSYYLLAVLASPISRESGWSLTAVVAGLSMGLLVAGFASPKVGGLIAAKGGRPVLAASAVLLAIGQIALAASNTFPFYIVAWILLGCGMGAGLYDPAFATLGRLYGQNARAAITSVTLFGGLASTVCWPLTAFLEAHWGWRTTCLVYAAFQLAVALPIYLFAVPEPPSRTEETASAGELSAASVSSEPGLFVLLATVITVGAVISATLSVHLLTVLQARGIGLGEAVGFGALVGPAQVFARAIEMAIARYHHPIWTKLASTFLVAVGVGALLLAGLSLPFALVAYGAGIGLESIARGTLPLAVFGPQRYPIVMGRIAMPSLIAQALTPSAAAVLLQWNGASALVWVLLMLAGGNLMLTLGLFAWLERRERRLKAA